MRRSLPTWWPDTGAIVNVGGVRLAGMEVGVASVGRPVVVASGRIPAPPNGLETVGRPAGSPAPLGGVTGDVPTWLLGAGDSGCCGCAKCALTGVGTGRRSTGRGALTGGVPKVSPAVVETACPSPAATVSPTVATVRFTVATVLVTTAITRVGTDATACFASPKVALATPPTLRGRSEPAPPALAADGVLTARAMEWLTVFAFERTGAATLAATFETTSVPAFAGAPALGGGGGVLDAAAVGAGLTADCTALTVALTTVVAELVAGVVVATPLEPVDPSSPPIAWPTGDAAAAACWALRADIAVSAQAVAAASAVSRSRARRHLGRDSERSWPSRGQGGPAAIVSHLPDLSKATHNSVELS